MTAEAQPASSDAQLGRRARAFVVTMGVVGLAVVAQVAAAPLFFVSGGRPQR